MDPTPPSSQAGQTLIEVLVTALVVALIAAGTATVLIATAHASGDQRMHAEADALATKDQERMRGLSDEQLAGLGGAGKSYTEQADGTTFTVTSTTTAVSSSGVSSCAAGGASDFRITSTVSWGEGWTSTAASNPDSVTVDSLLARPTIGDLLAVVTDQTGAPVADVSGVVESGPTAEQGVTDANGCLLFAGLTQGAYEIEFSKAGYVDPSGDATPEIPIGVNTSGTPLQNTLSMGLAGSITANLSGAGATTTAGDADSLSWSSVGHATPSTTPETPVASSLTTPALYPFDDNASGPPSYTDNYTVWAGHCPQQEPPAHTTATVSPGPDVTVPISEPELDIAQTLDRTGVAATPTALKLSFASLPDISCTDVWSPPVATATGTGVPPTTGWLRDPGQPYADGTTGSLTVCASYQNGRTTYHGTAPGVSNADFTEATVVSAIKMNMRGPC